MLEFGARSTGEPNTLRDVTCDAAAWLWEKATAIHVFCLQQRLRGDRFSRHWHDLARLDDAGIAATALADNDVAMAVARHKTMFFAEKSAGGERIDYEAAVRGGLKLVPDGAALASLERDYDAMIADGLLQGAAEAFQELMSRCRQLEERANTRAGAASQ